MICIFACILASVFHPPFHENEVNVRTVMAGYHKCSSMKPAMFVLLLSHLQIAVMQISTGEDVMLLLNVEWY